MAFNGLMLLRDEEDIIGECLEQLLTWIDRLYILDLGSVDATWEIVQDFARRDKRIVPWMHKPIVYNDNLRCTLFHEFRNNFEPGDWVMKIDADEFYHVPPPRFVKDRLGKLDTAVHLQWYFFRLTDFEVADYETGRVNVWEDRKRPILERRRYYKISEYAEPRMFKYRRAMQWPENASMPFNAGFVARERIPIRHYPHRDPVQMERRMQLRAAMMKLKAHAGGHWKNADWRKEIVDRQGNSIALKTKVGVSGESGIDTGDLLEWKVGTELQEVPLHNHVPGLRKRVAQRMVHPLLLPLLDRRRPGYSGEYQPTYIPEEVNREIYAEAEREVSQRGGII